MYLLLSFVPKLQVMGIFETLEDLYDLIKTFFEALADHILTIVDYSAALVMYLGKFVAYLVTFYPLIPVSLQIFLPITLTLSIVLLILGRSNNGS